MIEMVLQIDEEKMNFSVNDPGKLVIQMWKDKIGNLSHIAYKKIKPSWIKA